MRTSVGILLIICTVATAIGLVLFVDSPVSSSTKPAEVIVASGDTLWSIAVKYAPTVGPRQSIEAIYALNHLNDAKIQPGQLLLVPQAQ